MKSILLACCLTWLAMTSMSQPARADVLWHNPDTDQVAVWLMNGTSVSTFGTAIQGTKNAGWKVVGAGDFDGNGKADVLWHNPDTDQVAVWLMNGTSVATFGTAIQGTKNAGWKVVGAGDFDGNGKADVLWHNPETDQVAVWLMNGTSVATFGTAIQGTEDAGWKVVGAGDFDGNGKADVLWHNPDTDQVAVWLMNGTSVSTFGTAIQGTEDAGWTVIGAGDFDGNGKADVLLHNPETDQVAVWLMNGTSVSTFGTAIQGTKNAGWKVIGAGDFDGNGKADVLWHNPRTDQAAVWLMRGTSVATFGVAIQGTKNAGWKVIAPGKFQ